jgi:hypothetical protein
MYLFFAGDDRCLLSVVNGTRESFSVFSKYANKQKKVRWVSIHVSKKYIYIYSKCSSLTKQGAFNIHFGELNLPISTTRDNIAITR